MIFFIKKETEKNLVSGQTCHADGDGGEDHDDGVGAVLQVQLHLNLLLNVLLVFATSSPSPTVITPSVRIIKSGV